MKPRTGVKKEAVAGTTSGLTGSDVPATVAAEVLEAPVVSEIDFGAEVRELEAYKTLEGITGLNISDLVAQMQANILGSAANFNDLFADIFKPAYAAVATGSMKAGRSGAAAATPDDRRPSRVGTGAPVPPPVRNSRVRVTKAASRPARKNAPSAPAVESAVPATAPATMTMSWLNVASGDKSRPQAAVMALPASPAPSPAEAMLAPSVDAEKGEWEVVKRKGKGRSRDQEAAGAIERLAAVRGASKSGQTSMPMRNSVESASGPRRRPGRGKGKASGGHTPA